MKTKIFIISMIILLIVCSSFVGCNCNNILTEKEYSLNLKICYSSRKKTKVEIITLQSTATFEEREKMPTVVIPLDSTNYNFFVDYYQFVDHPEYSDQWFYYNIRKNFSVTQRKIVSPYKSYTVHYITEKGTYHIRIEWTQKFQILDDNVFVKNEHADFIAQFV